MNQEFVFRRPLVLSTFDQPEAFQHVVYNCEDCACPATTKQNIVEGTSPFNNISFADTDRWICGQEVLEFELDTNHSVLFNPVGQGGAVVVNQSARELFHQFRRPSTFQETLVPYDKSSREFKHVLKRLVCLEMICPAENIQHPRFQSSQMLTAWLHITNACNLRCSYCYLRKNQEDMDEATGRSTIEAIIRSATKHNFTAVKFKYAGGEPSLNAQLVLTLHDYAQKLATQARLQLYGVMLSNGVALSSDLIEALKDRGIRVMISLDGIGDYHDAQRPSMNGESSFRLVERTISQLMNTNHPPHISITVTNRNLKGLSEVLRFVLERNLTFNLNFFRENSCTVSSHDLKYEEQAMIRALHKAFRVIEEYLPPWSLLGAVLDRGQLIQPRQRSCGVGQNYIVIDQRGRVAKCHMEIKKTLGDVFTADPLQLLRQDKIGVQNPSVEEKKECLYCSWRYWCSGGCPVVAYNATGQYDSKSPNCKIYKVLYPEALRLEGLRLFKYRSFS